MKIKLFIILTFCALSLNAQPPFQRIYGGPDYDEAISVRQTNDGGYAVAGTTSSYGAGTTDIFLMHLDTIGNQEWMKTYGFTNIEHATSMERTADTGYIIAGYTNSTGNGGYDAMLIKTDSLGNQQWLKTFGGTDWDFANSVKQTFDGGYIFCGSSYSLNGGDENAYIVKTDAAGNQVWSKTFGGVLDQQLKSILQTPDSQYIAVGNTAVGVNNTIDILAVRIDNTGYLLWQKKYGGLDDEKANVIRQTPSGLYIIGGEFRDSIQSQPEWIKIDDLGFEYWEEHFGFHLGDEVVNDLVIQTDGTFYCAATSDAFGSGMKDFWRVTCDSTCFFLGAPSYGGFLDDKCNSITITKDNGLVLAGSSNSYSFGNTKIYIIKTDSVGNTASNASLGLYEPLQERNMIIFPNPVVTISKIVIDESLLPHKNLSLIITDVCGKLIRNIPMKSKIDFIVNAKDYNDGIYFFFLNSSDGIISKGRFIVSR